MIKRLILTAALAAVPAVAGADRPPQYFGFNGGTYKLDPDSTGDVDGDFVNLRLGYELGRFLALEGRFGMDAGAAKVGNTNAHAKTRMGSAFVRLNLPFAGADVYALAGGGRTSFNDASGSRESVSGPAAGLGLELYGSDRTAVVLEGVRYEDDNDGDYTAYTLGFKHHFNWPALRD